MKYLVLLFWMMVSVVGVFGQTQPDGFGTEKSPYLIRTAEQLKWFADQVNSGSNFICGKLMDDIDYKDGSGNYYQTMIGDKKSVTAAYMGTFDGNDHKITIGFNFQDANMDCVGLFGFVDDGVVIKNLTVEGNLTINGTWWHVGGIVGGDCTFTAANVTITNCKSQVNIDATKKDDNKEFVSLGGIIGVCEGQLMMGQCSFTGSVKTDSQCSGGDAGKRAIIFGGLAGSAKTGYIKDSYVYIDTNHKLEFWQNYVWYGETKPLYTLCGNRNSWSSIVVDKISNCYFYVADNKASYRGSTFTPTSSSNMGDFQQWQGAKYETSESAILDGLANSATMMYIYNATDMQRFANAVKNGNTKINGEVRKCFDYSGDAVGNNNKMYSGVFNGNNHTIKLEKTLAQSSYYGLFMYINNAQIINVHLAGSVSGGTGIGALICVSTGENTVVNNCISSVSITTSGSAYIGGFLMRPDANITFNNCAFVGSISAKGNVGGFIGYMPNSAIVATFNNCYTIYGGFNPFAPRSQTNNSYSLSSLDAKDFASGEICFKLNQSTSSEDGPWYQNITADDPKKESKPVHAKCECPEHAGEDYVVYQNVKKGCPGQTVANDEYPITESYDNQKLSGDMLYRHKNHLVGPDGITCVICGQKVEYDSEGNFVIYNAERLQKFADAVSGNPELNAIVLADFTAKSTTTIGSNVAPYKGVFDGGYNTITIQGQPLFSFVSSATIKNLIVAGSLNTTDKNEGMGSVVARNIEAGVTLEKCISTTAIENNSTTKLNSKQVHYGLKNGGLIGSIETAGWEVNNCAFAGSLPRKDLKYVGGIVGYVASNCRGFVRNSFVYLASSYTRGYDLNTIAPRPAVAQNCYYSYLIGTKETTNEAVNKSVSEFSNGSVRDALNSGSTNAGNVVWYHCSAGDPGNNYPTVIGSYVWQGVTSTDWSVESNWKNNFAPYSGTYTTSPAYSTASIPAVCLIRDASTRYYPNLSSNLTIDNSVDIYPSAELTIEGSAVVSINGNINNEGKILLQGEAQLTTGADCTLANNGEFEVVYGDNYAASGHNDSPNFIINGTPANNTKVTRHMLSGMLYYTGTATQEKTIADGFSSANTDYLAYYYKPARAWIEVSSSNAFNAPKRYSACTVGLVRPAKGTPVSMTQNGTLQKNEDIEMELTYGYNWVCNPYPYSLDVKKALLDGNDNIIKTIWTRENGGASSYKFVTYNASAGEAANVPDGIAKDGLSILAPFQDYCVSVKTGGTYTLKANCYSTTHSKLKSATIDDKDVIRISVTSNNASAKDDEAVIVMKEGGVLTVTDDDSEKQVVTNCSQIDIKKIGSATRYVIGLYPEVEEMVNVEVPMYVAPYKKASTVTIKADVSRLNDAYAVVLVDHTTNEEVLMGAEGYTVSVASGLTADRFGVKVIKVKDDAPEGGIATGVETAKDDDFSAYGAEGVIVVKTGTQLYGEAINVVDMMGREVVKHKISASYNVLKIARKGVYIVTVGENTAKVMVK